MKKILSVVVVLVALFCVNDALAWQDVSTAVTSNFTTGTVTCASVAAQVVASGTGRVSVGFVNNDATNVVYIGRSTVTTATGIPIYAKSGLVLDRTRAAIYCITANPLTVDLRYWVE